MKLNRYIVYAMIVLSLSGCADQFLEEEPLKQTSIKEISQLEALLDNAPAYYQETNYTAGYSTDDTEITQEQYRLNPARFGLEYLNYYIFNVDQIVNMAADALWTGQYKAVFTANTILENLGNVTGTEEAKAIVKADAHFLRAYSMWVLVNHYCAPYSQSNFQSPGLPLKRSANVEESLQRASLKETYDFILSDLNEAMKTTVTDVNPLKPWRVSQKTVEAMFSRYYLFTGEYEKSLEYSNKALASATVTLKDYKTIVAGAPVSYTNPAATIQVPETYIWTAARFLYWPEFYYPRFTYVATQWFIPSTGLRAMYEGDNDLRYKWFMLKNGGRRFSVITPEMFRYSIFWDGRLLPSGPTRSEMILNKAEALARTNRFAEAMTAVNQLRAMRFTTPGTLTATDKNTAITQVLAERRREFPFAMRWLDIRRFSVNDYPQDDVTVTREFFKVAVTGVDVNTPQTYTLPAGSARYAVPVNGVEIDASKGQILQNVYP